MALPGARGLRAGSDLDTLAAQLHSAALDPAATPDQAAGFQYQAVQAAQAWVDALDGYTPTAEEIQAFEVQGAIPGLGMQLAALDFGIGLAEARLNLIVQLLADRQPGAAAALVPATLEAYRGYLALPGAQGQVAASDLANLAPLHSLAGLQGEAAQVSAAAAAIAPG
jgi:hypothetical protein